MPTSYRETKMEEGYQRPSSDQMDFYQKSGTSLPPVLHNYNYKQQSTQPSEYITMQQGQSHSLSYDENNRYSTFKCFKAKLNQCLGRYLYQTKLILTTKSTIKMSNLTNTLHLQPKK